MPLNGLGYQISPGFGSIIDRRRSALAGLGAGLLNGQPGIGVQAGLAADYDREQQQKTEAEQLADRNQTSQWVQTTYPDLAALPPAQGFQIAMQREAAKRNASDNLTTDQRNWMYAQEHPEFASFLNENGGGVEYGLTPIWGQFPDGSFGYGVQGKDGSFKRVDTGDLSILDPRSLNSEKAYGTATGKASGEAAASAPGDIAAAQTALDRINQIRTSPELDWATGFSAGVGGNAIPGTGRFGFQKLVDEAKSGAFLTAIQEMRGLGSLSNAEGQAATQAITRMNTALSKDDFLKALSDYEAIVIRGMERAQARINANGPAINPGQAPVPGNGARLRYNPQTGQLE